MTPTASPRLKLISIQESTLHLVLRLRGGGCTPITLAAGGKIEQTIVEDKHPAEIWDQSKTIVFNVQILNSADWAHVTGKPTPASPVNASSARMYGFPFFNLHEELCEVSGDFKSVKTVAEIDGIEEDNVEQHIIEINPPEIGNKFDATNASDTDDEKDTIKENETENNDNAIICRKGPLRNFRTLKDLMDEIERLKREEEKRGLDDEITAVSD